MARLSRIVLPGVAHHVTQRGNRRERVFFEDGDYALYLDLLADAARACRFVALHCGYRVRGITVTGAIAP